MEKNCMSCVHYQYHKDKVIGRKDEGLISVPIVEPAHFECDLGRGKTLCEKFEIQPTPFDGMIAKADEILNELNKEVYMESVQIGDFVIKLEGDKLVIQHVGAPNKVIAVIPSSSNKVIIDTKEV